MVWPKIFLSQGTECVGRDGVKGLVERRGAFRETLYADCPEEDVALARLLLTPEPLAPTPDHDGAVRPVAPDVH